MTKIREILEKYLGVPVGSGSISLIRFTDKQFDKLEKELEDYVDDAISAAVWEIDERR